MKIKRKTFWGGIIAALCACATAVTGLSLSAARGNTYANAAAANGSASVLSVDTKTGTANGNFENKIQGGQNEYVYFGRDFSITYGSVNHTPLTTPMKWRVLTKNDTKYGRGKNLLVQSESIYAISYNNFYDVSTLFWGTSTARALMNGASTTEGDTIEYYNAQNGTLNINPSSSAIVNTIATNGDSNFLHVIQGTNQIITRAQYWYNSSYTDSRVYANKFLSGYQLNANAAKTRSTDSSVMGTVPAGYTVIGEITSGDRMFYLDVEDYCNTASYGFVDSTTGRTYFEEIAAANSSNAFTDWQGGYPTYPSSNGIYSDALKLSSADIVMLRETDFVDNATTDQVACMAVYGSMTDSGLSMGNMLGTQLQPGGYARPATVLDLSQVLYANGSVGNVGSTLTDVTGTSTAKPEYKLYIKDSAFSNNGFAPVITSANGKVKVTFNNTSGKTGNLVLLLQDKNATDGSVAYQAVSAMNGGSAQQSIEFNIPSGCTYKNYIPTVMLTSANTTSAAAMATEAVYATYTQNGVIVPEDISGMEYNSAHSHWLDNLNLKAVDGVTPKDPVWIDKSMHCDSSLVNVKKIMYKSFVDGAADEDKTADGTSNIINAGVYTITLELVDKTNFHWADATQSTTDKTFKITVDRVKPNVKIGYVKAVPTTRYVTDNDGELPEIKNDHANATPGTLEWHTGQSPSTTNKFYYWKFEPDDANKVNYETVTAKDDTTKVELVYKNATVSGLEVTVNKVKDQNGDDTAEDVKIYDAFTLTDGDYSLKDCITVKLVYNDNDTTKKAVAADDYTLSVIAGGSGGKLAAGTVKIRAKTTSPAASGDKEITVLASSVEEIDATYDDDGTPLTYPVTEDDIKGNLTVTAKWNYSGSSFLDVDASSSDVTVTGTLEAGDPITLTVNYKGKTFDIYPKIEKGTLDMSGVSLKTDTADVEGSDGAYTFTYDKDTTVSFATDGDVKNADGDTVAATPTLSYEKKNSSGAWVACTASDLQNAGEYRVKATYAPDDANNYKIDSGDEVITVTLSVGKASYEMPTGYDIKKQVTYTGSAISLPANWIADLPDGVTVKYCEADGTTAFADKTAVGNYTVKAVFSVADSANYNVPDPVTLTFEITNKKIYNLNVTFSGDTVTYDGQSHTIAIEGDLPDGVTVEYFKADGTTPFTGATNVADSGTVIARFTHNDPEYADIPDMTATLTIEKADYDMSGVTFEDKTVTYTGEAFDLAGWIDTSSLPAGVTVTYTCGTDLTSIGEHAVTASFTNPDPANYNDIADMTAKLTISDAVVSGVSVVVEDGAKFDVNNTLDDLKAKIKAEIEYNNGTKEEVAVDSLTLTCDTLRDGGKFEVGAQTITIKYTDEDGTEHTTTVDITVAKAKVALPVYNGTLSYTGDAENPLKPTAADFEGFDGSIMSLSDKTQGGVNAGAYKAVFALTDPDRYEWATTTSLKKSVFAAVVFDGETEIALEANEAAVEWNIAKAKISATKAEGKLPVFASESFTGSLGEVVALKYYTDETCTEEVAADALDFNTNYFVKAELLDKNNFELDETATVFAATPFEYLTPEKELTFWEKVVKFLTSTQMGLAVWLWIVIAVVALILLITIIALAVRSAKKKRIREERRLAEEKAERERKEEERERKEEERREREEERRREEREERMMRMSQPQMQMPSMMPQMPMQQPQYAPQAQGSAAGGGSISPELLAIITGMNGKIEKLQSDVAANELAVTREALAQARNELMMERMHGNSPDAQITANGLTASALTEIVTAALKNVFTSASQQTIAAPAAQPAQLTDGAASATPVAAQVPPDAVMTTVTTTKIDTTKKPAQGAQAPRQTRSFVPPMPVDDGRVFDVGGFYTPADPMDLVDSEDDKK